MTVKDQEDQQDTIANLQTDVGSVDENQEVDGQKPKTQIEIGRFFLKERIKSLPNKPGIYQMMDEGKRILYIGKAINLKKRVVSYTKTDDLPTRLKRMVAQVRELETIITQNEVEALLLESNLIKKVQPPYNILLKDDKSYAYLYIDNTHNFPRVQKFRGQRSKDGKYFGPFASAEAIDETILSLQKIFKLRVCKDTEFAVRKRPCLQYDIKRCSAPCTNKITQSDYDINLSESLQFLNGKSSSLQKILAKKMQAESDQLNFENAANLRDRITLLTRIQADQRINLKSTKNADIFAIIEREGRACVQVFFFRNGHNFGAQTIYLTNTNEQSLGTVLHAFLMQFYQNRRPEFQVLLNIEPNEFELLQESLAHQHNSKIKWRLPKRGDDYNVILHAQSNAEKSLERKLAEQTTHIALFKQLAELIKLPKTIDRIECYDNSHIQGKFPYGVMVAANTEGFDKKSYRKFSIKTPQPVYGGDDYAMMREVLARRISHAKDWPLPEVMLIDGGKGQIAIAQEKIEENKLETIIVGIAKGENRNAGLETLYLPDKSEIPIERNSALFYFLQRLRDEAHRFAIKTHRNKRTKNIGKSALDTIDGIGSKRKKALLSHFGSVKEIKYASITDIKKVPGINSDLAEKIYNSLH